MEDEKTLGRETIRQKKMTVEKRVALKWKTLDIEYIELNRIVTGDLFLCDIKYHIAYSIYDPAS